jgi:hypothetical protein
MPETTETPVLDLLAKMTEDSTEHCELDPRSFMMARIAALSAVDAPPISYLTNLGAAQELDITIEDLQRLLAAVAPIVDTALVASAAGNIARAFRLRRCLAEAETEAATR